MTYDRPESPGIPLPGLAGGNMHDSVEFRVLGPLEIRVGGRARPAGSPKLRTVLGLLLAKANLVVTHDELIDELWGAAPPASGAANIRSYVARIRQSQSRSMRTIGQARTTGTWFAARNGPRPT